MTFETRLDEAFGIQTTMKKTLFERKLEELDWRKAIGAAGMGLAALGGAGEAGAAPAQVAQAQELGAPTKPKTADDKAEELVKPVRDVYDKDLKVAQEKYNKVLAVELDKATKAGSLDDVKAIKKEMEEPEGDESKWKSPAHKLAAKQFTAMKEAAQKKWDAGIAGLVRQLVQKKELEVAEKVKGITVDLKGILEQGTYTGRWGDMVVKLEDKLSIITLKKDPICGEIDRTIDSRYENGHYIAKWSHGPDVIVVIPNKSGRSAIVKLYPKADFTTFKESSLQPKYEFEINKKD